MFTELRLHGRINPYVEYYATAAGCRSAHHHFYAVEENRVRFFSPGNELILAPDEMLRRGAGGNLNEYMFGDNRPDADLIRTGGVNRLVVLGAFTDATGQLRLNNHNQSSQSYNEIFTQGHAVHNYFFFIDGLKGNSVREQQEQLLRLLGKTLKRLPELSHCDDSRLAAGILAQLPPGCTLYLIRLCHTHNRQFQQELGKHYYPNRNLDGARLNTLEALAAELGIPQSQQERIRLDVYYRHRDNYRLADHYRKLLMTCSARGDITPDQQHQLTRLKTLAVRQQVPEILLPALERVYAASTLQIANEPLNISSVRNFLQRLQYGAIVTNTELADLLIIRQQARKHHDYRLEQLIRNIRDELEQRITNGRSEVAHQQLSAILTLLKTFDSTATTINRIVFLDNHLPTADMIPSLVARYQTFTNIETGLFEQLFLEEIQQNNYLGQFGRRKLNCLKSGLSAVNAGERHPRDLYDELLQITREEQHYRGTLAAARDWITTNRVGASTKEEQEHLYRALSRLLPSGGTFNIPLNPELFQTVVHDLNKEHLYQQQLLPEIITTGNTKLRKDFFMNSGLDFFHIEDLEQSYVIENNLDPDLLQRLQSSY